MTNFGELSHKLVRRRSRVRSWVYIPCAILVLLLGVWSTQEGPWVTLPYIAIFALLAVQFFRPTVLGWFVSFSLFAIYAIAVFVKASFPGEYGAGLMIGLVPAAMLFWARPQAKKENGD